jgi:hypothetical protein
VRSACSRSVQRLLRRRHSIDSWLMAGSNSTLGDYHIFGGRKLAVNLRRYLAPFLPIVFGGGELLPTMLEASVARLGESCRRRYCSYDRASSAPSPTDSLRV